MPPIRNKRDKHTSSEKEGAVMGMGDKTGDIKKDPWDIVDAAIHTDEKIRESGAPEEWIKIALDNSWPPWCFRMGQPEHELRLRTFDHGMEEFEHAWATYAGIPKLTATPGPNVRNVVVQWAKQLREQTGIKGSPIKMISLLHFNGELIDRSSPELMGNRVEQLFIPACEKATMALEKRLAFF